MTTDYMEQHEDLSDRHTPCRDKKVYETLAEAQLAAFRTRSLRRNPGSGLQGYACPHCSGFHAGHLPVDVDNGLVTHHEWYTLGAGSALRAATAEVVRVTGRSPHWSRVGEAWRAMVAHPVYGDVASKPSADPGLAAESLLQRLRRRGGESR